jgi:hypothetical protein
MQQNIHSVAPSGPKMDGHAALATFREAIDWAPPRQGRKELDMSDDGGA